MRGVIRCLAFCIDATLLPLSRRDRLCWHLPEEKQHPAVISGRWAQVSFAAAAPPRESFLGSAWGSGRPRDVWWEAILPGAELSKVAVSRSIIGSVSKGIKGMCRSAPWDHTAREFWSCSQIQR